MCVRVLSRVRRGGRDDSGFTLVELLVSVTILGVIMGSITLVTLNILKVNRDTAARVEATRSEQFAATYFANDVQGMRSGGMVTSGTSECGGLTSFLVEFRGDTYDPANVATARRTASAYVLQTVTEGGVVTQRLRRLSCEGASGSGTLTPQSDVTLVGGLSSVAPGAPTASGIRVSWTLTRQDGTSFTLIGVRRTT